MRYKTDSFKVGDLISADFLKQGGLNSNSFNVLYKAVIRTDLIATDPGVKNTDPITDDSDVYELVAP